MAIHTDLPIYRTGVRLLTLAIKAQEQMPRGVKRSMGDKISAHCVEMLDLMALANATKHRERADELTGHRGAMLRFARPHSLGIGFGSPMNHCDESRRHRTGHAAFSFVPLFRRLDGRAQALPVHASGSRSSNLSSRRHGLEAKASVFENRTTWRPIMADLYVGVCAQPTPFSFNGNSVRVVDRDGEPWFVASDVCAALGYVNTSKAIADHLDADERSHEQLDRTRMGSAAVIINESGLYALVLRSRKPEARKFAKWVTSEVLPAIRKTGSYRHQPSIRNKRWLISICPIDGREQIQPVPEDAAIVSPSSAKGVHAFVGEMVPLHLLTEVIDSASRRLSEHLAVMHSSAQRKLTS